MSFKMVHLSGVEKHREEWDLRSKWALRAEWPIANAQLKFVSQTVRNIAGHLSRTCPEILINSDTCNFLAVVGDFFFFFFFAF